MFIFVRKTFFFLLDLEMSSLANVTDLCTTASKMLKTAVFSAWAVLLVASSSSSPPISTQSDKKGSYLDPILEPNLDFLSHAWVDCLVEYAFIRDDDINYNKNKSRGSSRTDSDEEDSLAGGLTSKGTLVVRIYLFILLSHRLTILVKAS